MKNPNLSWSVKAWLGMALIVVGLVPKALPRPVPPAQAPSLAVAPGVDKIQRQCLSCHEADLIVQQRLTRARWGRELDKMVRWGAVVTADDREIMLTYLVTHYGDPSGRIPHSGTSLPAGAGADKVSRHCLTCHEADIIIGQNLTRAQWSKELDKMIRWGAVFPPEDRESMLAYLASHFGPEAVDAPPKRP